MLTLETGEGLALADSYVDLAYVRDFAVSRGTTVSDDDDILEGQIRQAHDFLFQYEARFRGYRRVDGQALSFPRSGFTLYGVTQADGYIPTLLKMSVCQLVIELQTTDLLPTTDGRVAVREKVGPIETEYKVGSAIPTFPKVEVFLTPLLQSIGGLTTVRA